MPSGKILVAVAEEGLRQAVAQILRSNDFTVLNVASHEDAFQIAKGDNSIALVIVNLGHNASGLVLRTKFQDAGIGAKFIITTGGADPAVRQNVQDADIPLLQLPADVNEILKVVRRQLV